MSAAACGLGPVDQHTTTAPAPAVTAAAPSSPGAGDRYPGVDAYADPLDRLAYRSAFDQCALFGVERLADDLGVRPDDRASVAEAYAEFADPSRSIPAARGCADGLAADGAPA